jgi:hypothetical protein
MIRAWPLDPHVPLLQYWPRGQAGAAGRFIDAGMDGEVIEHASKGKNPQHLLLWRGQQHITPGMPGLLPDTCQRRQAAGVDEFQPSQINDDLALTGHGHLERSHDTRSVCDVKLPRQRHDSPAAAFACTQIHANHKDAFLLQQQGEVWARRLIRQHA